MNNHTIDFTKHKISNNDSLDNDNETIILNILNTHFKVDKHVLSSQSEYFNKLFNGSFKEKDMKVIDIDLDDEYKYTSKDIHNMLTMIYHTYKSVEISDIKINDIPDTVFKINYVKNLNENYVITNAETLKISVKIPFYPEIKLDDYLILIHLFDVFLLDRCIILLKNIIGLLLSMDRVKSITSIKYQLIEVDIGNKFVMDFLLDCLQSRIKYDLLRIYFVVFYRILMSYYKNEKTLLELPYFREYYGELELGYKKNPDWIMETILPEVKNLEICIKFMKLLNCISDFVSLFKYVKYIIPKKIGYGIPFDNIEQFHKRFNDYTHNVFDGFDLSKIRIYPQYIYKCFYDSGIRADQIDITLFSSDDLFAEQHIEEIERFIFHIKNKFGPKKVIYNITIQKGNSIQYGYINWRKSTLNIFIEDIQFKICAHFLQTRWRINDRIYSYSYNNRSFIDPFIEDQIIYLNNDVLISYDAILKMIDGLNVKSECNTSSIDEIKHDNQFSLSSYRHEDIMIYLSDVYHSGIYRYHNDYSIDGNIGINIRKHKYDFTKIGKYGGCNSYSDPNDVSYAFYKIPIIIDLHQVEIVKYYDTDNGDYLRIDIDLQPTHPNYDLIKTIDECIEKGCDDIYYSDPGYSTINSDDNSDNNSDDNNSDNNTDDNNEDNNNDDNSDVDNVCRNEHESQLIYSSPFTVEENKLIICVKKWKINYDDHICDYLKKNKFIQHMRIMVTSVEVKREQFKCCDKMSKMDAYYNYELVYISGIRNFENCY